MTVREPLYLGFGRGASESRRQCLQTMSSIREQQLHSTAEPLLELVEALGILTQTLSGVRERKPAPHRHEIVAVVAQLST